MYEWILRTANKRTKVRTYEIRKWSKQPTNQRMYERISATNCERIKVRLHKIQKCTKQRTNQSKKGMNYDYECTNECYKLRTNQSTNAWNTKMNQTTNEWMLRTTNELKYAKYENEPKNLWINPPKVWITTTNVV